MKYLDIDEDFGNVSIEIPLKVETTGSKETVHFRKEYSPDILLFHGHMRKTLPPILK